MIDKSILEALRASFLAPCALRPAPPKAGETRRGKEDHAAMALRSSGCALRPAPSLAFFDLDGTMARGHMIFDFPAHLLAAGLFDQQKQEAVTRMRDSFSAGKMNYREVAEALPRLYALGVRGQKAATISLEAEKFVESRMGNVFGYARPLVMLMREHRRPGIAISGSPAETVRALARRLGMEAAIGTELRTEKGLFTGKVVHNFILKETKRAVFRELVKKLGLDTSACFGFGDTEEDASFLSGVGHPVALNPSPELRTIALKNGWDVFDHTQDVVAEVRNLAVSGDAVQG